MKIEETILSNAPQKTAGRLLQFFLLTSLVPIIAIFTGGYYVTQTMLQNGAIAKQTALVDQEHEKVVLLTEKLKGSTAGWASDGRIRDLAEKINDGGCTKAKTLAGCPLSQELSLYLTKEKLPLNAAIGMVGILNQKGIVIASNKPEHLGSSEGVQDTRFSEAVSLPFGQATFFPEFVSEEEAFNGRPMINLTAPIASPDGKHLAGVFLAHTESVEVNRTIAADEGITTETYLVNDKKKMVTPSRKDATTVFTQTVDTAPVRACIDHNENFQGSYVNYRGVEVVGASVCDHTHFGTLIMETEKSEIFAGINDFRNNAIIILAIILALIVGYAFFSGSSIFRGAHDILPKTFSSVITTIIIMVIMMVVTESASFFSARSIKNYIIEQKTGIIFDLVESEAEQHVNTVFFASWRSKEAQDAFKDFGTHLTRAYRAVSAINIYAPDSTAIWSSLTSVQIGTKESVTEINEAIKAGRSIEEASPATLAELGTKDLLEIYTPIKNSAGTVVAVAEVYFDTSDITSFIREFQLFLWIITIIALVGIFLLLRFVFRRQDARIIAQSDELKSIIEESPIGIYTVTKKGIIETFNPKMVEIAGIKNANELIGKNVFEMESYKEAGLDKLITDGLAGIAFEKELEVISLQGGGKKTYRHYRGVPLKDTQGNVSHLLLMVEDITERKILQAKAEEHAKGLEAKIAERTKELQARVADLEQFERVTVGRELRMTELKQEVEKMRIKLESFGVTPDKTVL